MRQRLLAALLLLLVNFALALAFALTLALAFLFLSAGLLGLLYAPVEVLTDGFFELVDLILEEVVGAGNDLVGDLDAALRL